MNNQRPSGRPTFGVANPRGGTIATRAVAVVTRPTAGNPVPPNVKEAAEQAKHDRLPARRDRLVEGMNHAIFGIRVPEGDGELSPSGSDPNAYIGRTPPYAQSVKIAKKSLPGPFLDNRE